jgi:hypothetical protein
MDVDVDLERLGPLPLLGQQPAVAGRDQAPQLDRVVRAQLDRS